MGVLMAIWDVAPRATQPTRSGERGAPINEKEHLKASEALENYREIRNNIIVLSESVADWLDSYLGSVLPKEPSADVVDSLEVAMSSRALFGLNDYMDEKLFRAYQASGYPCGWIGDFPDGQLVVFSRE